MEKKRGAPKKAQELKKDKRLGVIQITATQLADYEKAAELEGKSKSDWVRDTLDAKAKQAFGGNKINSSN